MFVVKVGLVNFSGFRADLFLSIEPLKDAFPAGPVFQVVLLGFGL